jgi:hypoxanthine phosphoribosyltransferase
MSVPKLVDALANSHVVHDRATLEAAILRLADEIRAAYADGEVPVFLTVMNGGLPFAAQLAFALGERGLDLQFDYLHATRYRGQTSGSGLAWLHRPATPLRGRKVLLADDILDEGHTLLAVKHWCEDQGAAEVRVAVLAEKVHDRCVYGICADHVGVQVPDAYVFGYGMDFHEQGRNLPAIYALGE